MEKMLVKYVRKGAQRKRVGVVVAIGNGKVGWSLCNKLDAFDKDQALSMAKTRAENGKVNPVPQSVAVIYAEMVERADRFYK